MDLVTNPLDPAIAALSAPADRRYRPDTGCAAMALQRGDSLIAVMNEEGKSMKAGTQPSAE